MATEIKIEGVEYTVGTYYWFKGQEIWYYAKFAGFSAPNRYLFIDPNSSKELTGVEIQKECPHKIGDTFKVLENAHCFKEGDVVEFIYDDNSYCPEFKRVPTATKMYEAWYALEKVEVPADPRLAFLGISIKCENSKQMEQLAEWFDGGTLNYKTSQSGPTDKEYYSVFLDQSHGYLITPTFGVTSYADFCKEVNIEPIKPEPKFKVGDSVKIINNDLFHHYLRIGDITTITRVVGHDDKYIVKALDDHPNQWVLEGQLERVKETVRTPEQVAGLITAGYWFKDTTDGELLYNPVLSYEENAGWQLEGVAVEDVEISPTREGTYVKLGVVK
jgi:hypothetical protein